MRWTTVGNPESRTRTLGSNSLAAIASFISSSVMSALSSTSRAAWTICSGKVEATSTCASSASG